MNEEESKNIIDRAKLEKPEKPEEPPFEAAEADLPPTPQDIDMPPVRAPKREDTE